MRAFRLFKFGVSATLSHLGLAVVACSAFGGFIGLASAVVYSQEHAIQLAVGPDQWKSLLVFAGIQLLAQVVATILIGPVFQATAAYAAFRHSRAKVGSLRHGLNFALSRYGRMFKPHLKTWLLILLGLQLLIPGIIYWNQLALVDSVTVFEDSKRPLARSRQLTRGYRRSVFLVALPWFLYGIPAIVVEPTVASISPALMVVYHIALTLYLFAMFAGYSRLYLERTGQHEAHVAGGSGSESAAPAVGD